MDIRPAQNVKFDERNTILYDEWKLKNTDDVKEIPIRFVINISGTKFEVSDNTYMKAVKDIPSKYKDEMHIDANGLYVERHPGSFQCILYYQQGGDLHLPNDVCPSTFKREMEFWGIQEHMLAKCCYAKYMAYFDDEKVLKILEADELSRLHENRELLNMSRRTDWRGVQGYTWLVLNELFFSISSKVYFGFSALLIIVSIFALVAGTHPNFQRDLNAEEWKEYFGKDWDRYNHLDTDPTTEPESEPEAAPEQNASPEPETLSEPEPISESDSNFGPDNSPEVESENDGFAFPENAYARFDVLDKIELTCMGVFTLDLLVRIVCCPFRLTLLTSFLNWVDILALFVMYLRCAVELMFPKEKYEASILDIVHCLQVVRVFRLFRLVKNCVGFRVLYYAFRASFTDLMLMSMMISVATLLFSTFVYFSGDDNFPSIPDSFWWVIITMATVGYGDIVPKLAISKTIGVFCAICGVCLIAIVVPIFVNNFMLFYTYSKVWGKMSKLDNVEMTNMSTTKGMNSRNLKM